MTQEQQTCRALVPSARQEMKRPGAFTAKPCGLPIEGYGECAECLHGEHQGGTCPDLMCGCDAYQPSQWRHVIEVLSGQTNAGILTFDTMPDERGLGHPATPVGETR